jgi:hypothetical protein
MHVQPVRFLVTETFRQVKQVLGDPPWDVGEHQVRGDVGGTAPPLGERPEQVQRYLGTLAEQWHERLVLE